MSKNNVLAIAIITMFLTVCVTVSIMSNWHSIPFMGVPGMGYRKTIVKGKYMVLSIDCSEAELNTATYNWLLTNGCIENARD